MNILYCFTPVYLIEMSKTRKHLKNKYARDDPGFLLLLLLNLFVSSVVFNLTLSTEKFNLLKIFHIFFIQTFFLLLLSGLIISLTIKFLFEKYLNCSSTQTLEYAHAFDIHSNSFVVLYSFGIIANYLLLPLTSKDNYFGQILVSNCFMCYGCLYYLYVSYIEYFSLPFIKKNQKVDFVIWIIFAVFFLLSILKINVFKEFIYFIVV